MTFVASGFGCGAPLAEPFETELTWTDDTSPAASAEIGQHPVSPDAPDVLVDPQPSDRFLLLANDVEPARQHAALSVVEAALVAAPATAEVQINTNGDVQLISGRFDVGCGALDLSTLPSVETLSGCAQRFLTEQADVFGVSAGRLLSEVRFVSTDMATDDIVLLRAAQVRSIPSQSNATVSDVEIDDGQLTFVFSESGHLLAIDGAVIRQNEFSVGPTTEIEAARAVDGPSAARLVVDAERGVIAWRVTGDTEEVYVDSTTGEAYDRALLVNDDYVVEPIGHSEPYVWVGGGYGYVMWDVNTDDAPWSYSDEKINVGQYYNTSYCRYTLEYGVSEGFDWAITRVDTGDGLYLLEDILPCSYFNGFTHSFGDGTWARQQNLYYWTRVARRYLRPNAFLEVSPTKTHAVSLLVDADDECTGSVCFKSGINNPRIILDEGSDASMGTIAHEYGHYTVWAYGDLGNKCVKGINESNPLNESVADAISMIIGKDRYDPGYQIEWNRIGNGGGRHTNSSNKQTYGGAHCFQEVHGFGDFFEQAIWELLHDIDCTASHRDCTTFNGTLANDIGFSSSDEARELILGAIAYALDVTGKKVTYPQFRAQMIIYLDNEKGSVLAAFAYSIMAHHGF